MTTTLDTNMDHAAAEWAKTLNLVTQSQQEYFTRLLDMQSSVMEMAMNAQTVWAEPTMAGLRAMSPFLPPWMVWHNGLEQLG